MHKEINLSKNQQIIFDIIDKSSEPLKSYEKGISLIKNAQSKLKKIEQKVEILSKEGVLENFNTNE